MKWLASLVLFTLLALLAWPYVYLWRLDNAVVSRDLAALQRLVDLDAVRAQVKADYDREVASAVGNDGGRVTRWLKEGIGLLTEKAVEANIDLQWVMNAIGQQPGEPPRPRSSLIGDTTYAFYESTDRFLVRLGDLGDRPVHIRMALTDGEWRVIEVFEAP